MEVAREEEGFKPSERVLVLTAVLGAMAAALHWLVVRNLGPLAAPFHLPWPVLTVAFVFTDVFVVHLEFRRESHSISMSELSLVIGLLFFRPADIVFARLLGTAIALIFHRRQFGTKLLFTLAQFALQATVAVALFRLVLGDNLGVSPRGWAAAFAAT